ncbi:MAG TPA: class I tRNA ligase family protein, partial [Flavobacterium sp.]|nr:class I tRNA ligase family protein [Flavobacterium sp.]
WEVKDMEQPDYARKAVAWYEAKLNKTLVEIEDHFEKYRISDALMAIYKLVWDDFCSWFLEMIKPGHQQPIDSITYAKAIEMLEANLKLLHPFMPFLTEEIWHLIAERTKEEALIIAKWPNVKQADERLIAGFEVAAEVISGVRTIRKEKNIAFKDAIELKVINTEGISDEYDSIIAKLGNISSLGYTTEKVNGALTFRVRSNEYFVPMAGNVNIEEEIAKLTEELKYNQGFLKSVQAKLANEKFVGSAPEKVVAMERQKEADALAKIATIEQSLSSLR